jgi:hypothetical protein
MDKQRLVNMYVPHYPLTNIDCYQCTIHIYSTLFFKLIFQLSFRVSKNASLCILRLDVYVEWMLLLYVCNQALYVNVCIKWLMSMSKSSII